MEQKIVKSSKEIKKKTNIKKKRKRKRNPSYSNLRKIKQIEGNDLCLVGHVRKASKHRLH